jgi:glycosyltransferase involved in cell wall biosynthesis
VSSEAEVKYELPHVAKNDIHCFNQSFLWDEFFSQGKSQMLRTLLANPGRAGQTHSVLSQFTPENTLVHFHGFHNKFSFSALEASVKAGFKTLLTAHDYGIQCPNSTFFNYPEMQICNLKPLTGACLKCKCVSANDNRYKQYRFFQAFGAVKLRGLHKKLHAIFAVSPFEKQIIESHWGSLENLHVLENPIEVKQTGLRPATERSDYLWIGRITEEKNLGIALQAARQCGVMLKIVGDGPLREAMQKEFPEFEFVGWKDEAYVFDQLQKSRGLLLTSKWYETASLIALESLAVGTPVAIPNTCAATSWIEADHDALTFDAGSADSLAQVIRKLESLKEWDKHSQSSYRRYWTNPYTNERYLQNLETHYERLMN